MTRLTKDRLQKVSGGGLSIGAGDADQVDLRRRVPIKVGSHLGESLTAVGDEDPGRGKKLLTPFQQDGFRPSLDGLFYKLMAIRLTSSQSGEEKTFLHPLRMIGNPSDLFQSLSCDLLDLNPF